MARKQRPAPPITTPPAGSLVRLPHTALKTHPHNMRRFYPAPDVRQMAESIQATGGVIQPLIIVPDGQPGTFYVVDGNMRLAAARYLAGDCPPLECKVVDQAAGEQLLTMVAANTVRYDVDPISEALHYQRLQAEGLSQIDIAERAGVNHARVHHRLKLLKLDPEVQQLVAEGKLPRGHEVAEALVAIPDREARIKLARRMAEQSATAPAILAACRKLAEHFANPRSKISRARQKQARPRGPQPPALPNLAPALAYAQDRTGLGLPNNNRPEWAGVRAAARQMCQGCDIKMETLRDRFDEPAWALITHAADETCGNCNVREVHGACQGCPGVELISRLLRAAHPKAARLSEAAPERRY